MFNHAIRYQPILKQLVRRQPSFVLDVGSGPEGLGLFWRGPVIGVDYVFKRPPLHRAVIGSTLALPFADRQCPVVVSCDMLEHVPPRERHQAVVEMARVAGQTLLLAFPSGEAATQVYNELAQEFAPDIPQWLQEHLDNGLPDALEVVAWLQASGWSVTTSWYESALAHKALLRWEQRLLVKIVTYGLMRLVGPWFAANVPIPADGDPLRVFLVAVRQ